MAEKISNMDKEVMQMKLVQEFEKRINLIDKWEDKNPITVLLLQKNIFLSIKNTEELLNNEKESLGKKKGNKKETAMRHVDPEAEEERKMFLNYRSNVLKFLRIYEVATVKKTLKVKNPRFNPESAHLEDKQEFLSLVIREKNLGTKNNGVIDMGNLSTESFLYRLLGLTGNSTMTLEELVYKSKAFENKGYEINLDNFLKIVLIMQRAKLRIPVVCIGETGCGKTFMIKFISTVLMSVKGFFHLTLHTGYTELELKKFIMHCTSKARSAQKKRKVWLDEFDELKKKKYSAKGNRNKFNETDKKNLKKAKINAQKSDEYWIFYDEFNTSVLQNYICEMMIERVCSLLPFDPEVVSPYLKR